MMTNGWQEVPLKEVAIPISRSVPVEAGTEYRTIGVKWWGMGAYERETIDGSRTAAKTLSFVRAGDLIINKIWVRHGSVAIAGKDVDGCAGSGEFPTFELDLNRIDPRWIHWQTKMKSFWEKCDNLSRGTSGKNRIKPELFLTINIPLPPLDEQRRIVEDIESLAVRVHGAQRLREEAEIELGAFVDSFLGHLFAENKPNWYYGKIPEFAEVNPSRKGQITLKDEDLVSFVPMKAVDDITGIIAKPEPRPYHEVGKGYTWFQDGDVIFARITPCMENGKSAIAKNLVNGTGFGSTEFHVLRPSNKVLAEWLYILARSKQFRNDAAEHFKGTAGQQRVPQSFLDNKIIPVPPLDEQRRIVTYLDGLQAKVNALRELQSTSGEELSAMMPSVLDRAFKGEL